MKTSPLVIETHHLTKRYGRRPAVADLDLAVPRGSSFGLLGHNGAGKTTLIRLLVGLTEPDAGTISIAGEPLDRHNRHVLSRVGAIIEEPRFHGHLTANENLRVVAAVRGGESHRRIEAALDRVGLADRAHDRVRTYSQGMRQRLGIARCLLADPELVILDEPTNGLDPAGILELRALVGSLVAEGRTVFVSSHLLGEVEKMCDTVAVIAGGHLVWQGRLELLGTDGSDDGLRYAVVCDAPEAAARLLAGHPLVTAAAPSPTGVEVALVTRDGVSAVNAHLVRAGIRVGGVTPLRSSLEDRFLEITARAGAER
jgi:ABC-2 type transport system ATP-binding protein